MTLDEDLIDAIRVEVGDRGFSSFANLALREKLEAEAARLRVLDLIDELERADPSSEPERAAGERWAKEIIAAIQR